MPLYCVMCETTENLFCGYTNIAFKKSNISEKIIKLNKSVLMQNIIKAKDAKEYQRNKKSFTKAERQFIEGELKKTL